MPLQLQHPTPSAAARASAAAARATTVGRRGLALPAPGHGALRNAEPAGLQAVDPTLADLLAPQPDEAAEAAPTEATADTATGPLNAPASTHIIPFDRRPLVAPGERIIFNANFTHATPAAYRLDFSSTGGRFNNTAGPASQSIAGLASGNLDFFVPAAWDGSTTLRVKMKLVKVANGSTVRTESWHFGLKTHYPTTMVQQETSGERALGSVYSYKLGPALPRKRAPHYKHTTVLERFGAQTLGNIGVADIKQPYRQAHGLTTAAAVSAHFVDPGSGGNGTFTVDQHDQIYDMHGGHDNLATLVAQLVAPKAVDVVLPQFYEAQPGVTLGSYLVTRRLLADGTTWKLLKVAVP